MNTPYFPAFRCRLAALGRHTLHTVRQTTLAQLQQHLSDLLPAPRLCAEEDGPNSRERIFTLRLTCECFLWQMLKPKTSCREVVRQVQALLRLQGRAPIDEGDSAYIQARQRLPRERLEKALSATAQAPNVEPAPAAANWANVPSKWSMVPRRNCPIRPETRNAIRSRPVRNPVAAFR